jgi:tetratricopeptide (TPR) repeat protein
MRAMAPVLDARRSPIRPLALIAASLLAVAVSYVTLAGRPTPLARLPTSDIAAAAPAEIPDVGALGADLERIGAAIGTWSANLERDPADFIAAVNLAELYLARAHLTAAPDDYDRALHAVDAALETDATLLGALELRARVLFASHDFTGAEDAATALLAQHPALPQALATLGDARLELGDYAGAADAYRQITGPASPPMLARQARLEAVTGSLSTARNLAADALTLAEADPDTTAAHRSFYSVLVGSLAFQAGDLAAAQDAYRQAVEASPASPQALAGFGRTQAATGDLAGAIGSYEQAVAIRPEPGILAQLGDLLSLAGRSADAEASHDQVRGFAAISSEAGLFNRSIVLFLADHGESAEQAVALAEAELAARTDVYGWDAYAWALYADGRFEDAEAAIAQARAEGTQDALLDYHAGMIAAALGRSETAAELLQSALARNPAFAPLGAERARATLAELEARP